MRTKNSLKFNLILEPKTKQRSKNAVHNHYLKLSKKKLIVKQTYQLKNDPIVQETNKTDSIINSSLIIP